MRDLGIAAIVSLAAFFAFAAATAFGLVEERLGATIAGFLAFGSPVLVKLAKEGLHKRNGRPPW